MNDWEKLVQLMGAVRDHCDTMNRSEYSEIIDHTHALISAALPLVEMVANDGDYVLFLVLQRNGDGHAQRCTNGRA